MLKSLGLTFAIVQYMLLVYKTSNSGNHNTNKQKYCNTQMLLDILNIPIQLYVITV